MEREREREKERERERERERGRESGPVLVLSCRTATDALMTLQRAQLVLRYSMVVIEGPY
jgi:hypothetical protein